MTASQRAVAAAEIEVFRHGGARGGEAAGALTRAEQADIFHVSERLITQAAVVRDDGAPALQAAVKSGAVSVGAASEVAAALAQHEQVRLAGLGERAILDAASEIRKRKSVARRHERTERIKVIAAAARELDLTRRYAVGYVDPPWRYEETPMGDTGRSIENHYPTMTLDDICALPVGELLLPDAVLFLWVTAPHSYCSVPAVLDAWGFTFRSEIVWDKVQQASGYWTFNQHEKLLICTRGDIPAPHGDGARMSRSVHRETKGPHSVKPDYFPGAIERMFPEFMTPAAPLMVELFARLEIFDDAGRVIRHRPPRPGWDVWGNQALPVDDDAARAATARELNAADEAMLARAAIRREAARRSRLLMISTFRIFPIAGHGLHERAIRLRLSAEHEFAVSAAGPQERARLAARQAQRHRRQDRGRRSAVDGDAARIQQGNRWPLSWHMALVRDAVRRRLSGVLLRRGGAAVPTGAHFDRCRRAAGVVGPRKFARLPRDDRQLALAAAAGIRRSDDAHGRRA